MARLEAILSRFFTLNGAEMMRRDIPNNYKFDVLLKYR
jgi:hypothetical protein